MNKKQKAALKAAFSPPEPEKKREFIERLALAPAKPLGNLGFLLTQLGYIRARVWLLSLAVFVVCLYLLQGTDSDTSGYISALMPIIAVAVVCESRRSQVCGMSELELSTRFSLKSVLLARLCILGVSDLLLVLVLIPLAHIRSGATLLETAAGILCPYLLTVFTGLNISRKFRSGDATYACIGVAAMISIGMAMLRLTPKLIAVSPPEPVRLALLLAALMIATGLEFGKILKQTEELQWSLQ